MPERSRRGSWTFGLIGLWAFAVAQPLLDLIAGGPEFLLAHRLSGVEVLVVALTLAIGLPALVGGLLELLARPLPRVAAALALGCAAALLFVQLLQITNAIGLGALAAVVGAAAAAIALAYLIYRRRGFPGLSVGLSLCAAVFVLNFIFLTPVRGLLLPASAGAANISPVPEPRDVVLLVFDELPTGSLLGADGWIDASRFPAFARLAAEGTFFPNATAVHFSTSYAVPAILTGRIPDERRLPTHLDYPRNLFSWLAPTHEVRAVETMTSLCPTDECAPAVGEPWTLRASNLLSDLEILFLHHLLPEAWRGGLPPVTGTWRDFRRTVRPPGQNDVAGEEWSERYDVAARVERFLDGLADTPSPGLHYLHLELPHIPWRYLPDGREYGPISGPNFAHGAAPGDGRWIGTSWEITQALQRHLLQLAYADRLLGEILGALEPTPWRDALLIVTADHGLSFLSGEPGRQPEAANLGEVLSVPLLVRGLGPAGGVDERAARTTDVIATLAGAQGASPPWETDGADLFGDPLERPAQFVGADGWKTRAVGLEEVGRAIERARERIAAAFPSPGIAGLFEVGPRRELIGRSLEELTTRPSERRVALEQPWFLARVVSESGFLPAQIQGRVLGPAPSADTEVVVAVNGVLRASTRPYPEWERWHVSAILPPAALVAGANAIELLEVVAGDDSLELASWGGTSTASYTIERDGAGRAVRLTASDGSGSTVEEAGVPGRMFRQGLTFWGWAHDAAFERRTVILAFADGELIYATPTNQAPEPGTGPPTAPDDTPIGFRFALPRSLVGADSRIEIFAVAGDRASPL